MEKRLERSTDKKICGVCAGVAEFFGIDVTVMRVIYALLTVFSAAFPGVVLYIILAIIMPDKGNGYQK